MKSLFQNIIDMFRSTSKPNVGQTLPEALISPEGRAAVPENIFIETRAPELDRASEPAKANQLTLFLARDFQKAGYNDGYRYHAADVLDNFKRIIRCEFREIIEMMIDEEKSAQMTLAAHLLEVRSLSTKAEQKVSQRIVEITEAIERLQQEVETSSMDEGLVAKAICQYRDGFFRGMADYTEETLLMTSPRIFKY